jgi:LemA protein
MIALIVVGVLVILVIAFVWMTYNRLVAQRLAVDNSWSQIDVALKRRHDLIPNLVETVKGYATHEQQTFQNVTEARATAMATTDPAQQAVAEQLLGGALGRLMAVAEAYPELRATENFQQLQADLSDTENQIAITRRVYNDTVQTYNTSIQVFPAVLVARTFNFSEREFFDAPDEVEEAPRVSFATTPEPAAPAAGSAAPPSEPAAPPPSES